MTELIVKYLGEKRFQQIVKEKNYDEITTQEFIRFLNKNLKEDEDSGTLGEDIEMNEEEIIDNLNYVDEYMTLLLNEREKGFSFEWAKFYTHKIISEEKNALAYVYEFIYKINPKLALEELELYAKFNKRDQHFIDHFVFLFEKIGIYQELTLEEQAIEYSEIYKQEIKKGRSKIFASQYAFLKAIREYTDLACFADAMEFEKAIQAGYSEDFARIYSDEMSEYIANHFSTYEESIHDLYANMERKEVEEKHKHLK